MAQYAELLSFYSQVYRANPGFRRSASSLNNLLTVLEDHNGTAARVFDALKRIPQDKMIQYRDALWILQASYPGLPKIQLPAGELGKMRAAKYVQSPLAQDYSPGDKRYHKPHSFLLDMSVEQWLMNAQGAIGIIAIHLSSEGVAEKDLHRQIENKRVSEHINAVLRIGRMRGFDLMVLSMEARPLCRDLTYEANLYGNRKLDIHEPNRHDGLSHPRFLTFATTHSTNVVVGFDADICMHANLFGTNRRNPDQTFVPPLTTLTNVVTSRAVAVTSGNIGKAEYGVLYGK